MHVNKSVSELMTHPVEANWCYTHPHIKSVLHCSGIGLQEWGRRWVMWRLTPLKCGALYPWRSLNQSSGDGVNISHGIASWSSGSLQKVKTSRFCPLYFRGALSGLDWALLSLGWDLWGIKLTLVNVDPTWARQSM